MNCTKITNCPAHYHNNKTKKHMCTVKSYLYKDGHCSSYYNQTCPLLHMGRTRLVDTVGLIVAKKRG